MNNYYLNAMDAIYKVPNFTNTSGMRRLFMYISVVDAHPLALT